MKLTVSYYRKFRGSVLATVLVLTSIVGFFSIVVLASNDQTDSQRDEMHIKNAVDKVTINIFSVLQHHGTCKTNFTGKIGVSPPNGIHNFGPGFTKKPAAVVTGNFSGITNDLGLPLFETGNTTPYQNYGFLESITYIFNPMANADIAEVTLLFRKYKPIGGLIGRLAPQRGRTIARKIPVKMNFCRSEDINGDTADNDCSGAKIGDLASCFAFSGYQR